METIIFYSVPVVLILGVWYKEPRIFLFLTNLLFYSRRNQEALHINQDKYFPDGKYLEDNWQLMANELRELITNKNLPKLHHVDKVHYKISFDNGPAWRTIILKAYDGWFTDNCNKLPQTSKLLSGLKSVETAMINILEPGVKIPPHTGKFSGVLRYHLGLSIPTEGECFLVVNGEKYFWKNGEGILFDDTYVHSVENNTDEYRAVLLMDIKKPVPSIAKPFLILLRKVIRNSPIFSRAIHKGKVNLA